MRRGDRVRSTSDGQLGFVVEMESGGLGVRLDRRGEERVIPYREAQWAPDTAPRITDMQVARICHDADRGYRLVHGEYSQPDWVALPEAQRLRWMKEGPPKDAGPARMKLYQAIRKVVTE